MDQLMEHGRKSGFLQAVKNLGNGILNSGKNRFELFLLELREERARVLEVLLWAAAALFLTIMTFIIITMAVLLVFRGETQLYAAACFSVAYFILSAYSIVRLKKQLKQFSQFNRQCLESLK
jgi:uncharacterized membrane protein YqjE